MRRKISAFVVLTFIATFTLFNFGCSQSETNDPENENIDFDLNDPKIKDRLGEDDGYAFTVFYGADVHGSLETCG